MNLLDRAFAALYDPVMRSAEQAGLGAMRRTLLQGLEGHVVEIGAGTGANVRYYPDDVELLTLLEPTPAMAKRLRARVTGSAPSVDIEVLDAPAEAIPLADGAADAVVSVLVLCTVAHVDRSLAELHRVLRPGGRLVLIEHVATDGALGVVQRLLAPAWEVAARGCRLDRETRSAVAAAGFDVTEVGPWQLPGGGPAAPAIAGIARRT